MNDIQQRSEERRAAERPSGSQSQDVQRAERHVLMPAGDSFEAADGLTMLADLPGVSKDALTVAVDGDGTVKNLGVRC